MNRLITFCAIVGLMFVIAGNGLAADSEVPGDFATIQAAIDDVNTVDGDTITVTTATHSETDIHVTKSVTIQGQGINATAIQSPSLGTGIGFYIDVNDVTLQDMTIENFSQAVRFYNPAGTIDNTDVVNVKFFD